MILIIGRFPNIQRLSSLRKKINTSILSLCKKNGDICYVKVSTRLIKLKNEEEIKICVFCKHFGRYPGTKLFPMHYTSVCWYPEQDLHLLYQQNSSLFDEYFQN